ncbi:ADP-ribosylation factor 6-like [Lissotriton helveticus]
MGQLLSIIKDALIGFYGLKAKIVMMGLDAAGKTSILYQLKLNEAVVTIPTIGFNVETVRTVNNESFTILDVSGRKNIRALWKHYFTHADALLFVADSADTARIPEARAELDAILEYREMRGVPLVVLANKQDLARAQSPSVLEEELGLRLLDRDWHMQTCCATTGYGLAECLQKLSEMIQKRRKAIQSAEPANG